MLRHWPHGDRAITPLRESLRLHAKRVVEPCAVIFPCDVRGQFDELHFRELLSQLREQRFRNLDRRLCHRVRIFQHLSLGLGKQSAGSIAGQCFDLFLRSAAFSADRRTDVYSKRAPDERRDAQLRKVLQGRVHQTA